MAAPVYLNQVVDREGLTVQEYDRINEFYEDEPRRKKEFQTLIRETLQIALADMPKVLWNEIACYLDAPALPPALEATLEAKRKVAEQMEDLINQTESLLPQIQSAANASSTYLENRLHARRVLKERAEELRRQYDQSPPEGSTSNGSNTQMVPDDAAAIIPSSVLLVRNLPDDVQLSVLELLFDRVGFNHAHLDQLKSIALVSYDTVQQAIDSREIMQGFEITPGLHLNIQFAQSTSKPTG